MRTTNALANPAQKSVLASGVLDSGFNCVLQMPTGSGKTWLAECTIEQTLKGGKRAIYLSPLRALATELYTRWEKRFANHRVSVFTGETIKSKSSQPHEADVLIMTPERLDAYLRRWRSHWSWIPDVDLIVADEIHLLGDESRGATLECVLQRCLRLNPFVRVLALSATLGNREELADWLEGVEMQSNWSPVTLDWDIVRFRKAAEKPALLTKCLREQVRSNDDAAIVFVHSRRRSETLAAELRTSGISAEHHHAGLDRDKRNDIEQRFRKGETSALISTGTLEVGLNLPATTVVLYDLQRFTGQEFTNLPVNNVWQRAGRAGRPGLANKANVVLFAPAWDKTVSTYQRGAFEPIRSSLRLPINMAEQILVEVGTGLSRTRDQLSRTMQQTLGGKQSVLSNTNDMIETMISAGMLNEEDTSTSTSKIQLRTTRLGRIAIRHQLTPDCVRHMRESVMTELAGMPTYFDILLTSLRSPGFEQLLPCNFEELESLGGVLEGVESSQLRSSSSELLQTWNISGRRALAVIKTALAATQRFEGKHEEDIAEQFDSYAFEIRNLIESLDRHLAALLEVSAQPKELNQDSNDTNAQSKPYLTKKIGLLQSMLQHALSAESATLCMAPGIGGSMAAKLVQNGYSDVEDLAQAELDDLISIPGIGRKRASSFIDTAAQLISNDDLWDLRDEGSTSAHISTSFPSTIDPYRFGRSLELRVENTDQSRYQVTGGAEPHEVYSQNGTYSCDCKDHAAGNLCKHTLAVRLLDKDPQLLQLQEQLCQGSTGLGLDLVALWLERGAQ